jgi:hypothetical protein
MQEEGRKLENRDGIFAGRVGYKDMRDKVI